MLLLSKAGVQPECIQDIRLLSQYFDGAGLAEEAGHVQLYNPLLWSKLKPSGDMRQTSRRTARMHAEHTRARGQHSVFFEAVYECSSDDNAHENRLSSWASL
jgi:hypothetical protein